MSTYLTYISTNALLSTIVGGAILSAIAWMYRASKDRSDSATILDFLAQSRVETQHIFRSTEAIASKTKLTEERVAKLCAKHPKIQRNSKEKQSWKLAEYQEPN